MHQCPDCEFAAKSKGGLAGHREAKHPVEARQAGPVWEAVERQLPAGAPLGLRASALKLAWAMDVTESTRDLASLSRELRATLAEVGVDDQETEGDSVDELARRREVRRAEGSARAADSE